MATKKTGTSTTTTAKKIAPRQKRSAPEAPAVKTKNASAPLRTKKSPEKVSAKSATPAKAAKATQPVKPGQKAQPAPAKRAEVVAAPEKAPSQATTPSHAEIAARAAQIWRENGGTPFGNWLQAERELHA